MDINLDFFQGNLRDNTRKHIIQQGFKSIEDYARSHGIDKSTLSRMMNGNREPRLSTLLRISLSLGVSIDELCGAQLPQPKPKKGVALAQSAKQKPVGKLKPLKSIAKKATVKKVVVKKAAAKKRVAPKSRS